MGFALFLIKTLFSLDIAEIGKTEIKFTKFEKIRELLSSLKRYYKKMNGLILFKFLFLLKKVSK